MEETSKCEYDPKTQLSYLMAALRVEESSRDFFRRVSECIEDKSRRILLASLAEDEQGHADELSDQIDRLFMGEDLSKVLPAEEFMSIIPSMLFPFPPPGTCLPLEDEIKVMELAVSIEDRKMVMFQTVAGSTDDCQLRDAMTTMAERIGKQKEVLSDALHYLKRGGSWYGYSPILDG